MCPAAPGSPLQAASPHCTPRCLAHHPAGDEQLAGLARDLNASVQAGVTWQLYADQVIMGAPAVRGGRHPGVLSGCSVVMRCSAALLHPLLLVKSLPYVHCQPPPPPSRPPLPPPAPAGERRTPDVQEAIRQLYSGLAESALTRLLGLATDQLADAAGVFTNARVLVSAGGTHSACAAGLGFGAAAAALHGVAGSCSILPPCPVHRVQAPATTPC